MKIFSRLDDAAKQLNISCSDILQSCFSGEVELLLYIPDTCKVEIQYPNGVQDQLSSIGTLAPHKINEGDYTFLVLNDTHAKILYAERKLTVLQDKCNHFSAAYKLNQSSDIRFEKISTVGDVLNAMSLNYAKEVGAETQISNSNGFVFTEGLANEIKDIKHSKPQFKLTPKNDCNTNESLAITADDIFMLASEIERLRLSHSSDLGVVSGNRGQKLYSEYKSRKSSKESGIIESMATREGVTTQRIHQLMKPYKPRKG